MNDFVTEFEYYVTTRWYLEGKHYNLRGLFNFYEGLWTGDADKLKTPFGDASKVHEETDYANGQEERTMILKIGDRFVKKVGYYDSWESANWDGAITEVKPVEQTVVVYEAV